MKKISTLLALVCLLACGSAPKTTTPTDNNIVLFNGENLDGWKPFLEDSTLNPNEEFRVHDGVIWLSGKYGYIHTEKTYSDYELSVEWRWPEVATNSGIFLHVQPEYGIWPENFECQLRAGDAGDIYNAGGASCAEYRANPDHPVIVKRQPSNEKPVGEWNTAEITCKGDSITVYINGELQNIVTGLTKTSGYIGLQSEGEAIEFRHVKLTPLTE